jgi:hypothetical protein
MRYVTVLALFIVLSIQVLAQSPGNCQTGTAEADLNVADVQARLFTAGNLFFGNSTIAGDGYIAPKFSGNSPIFAAGIWVGGTINGDLRVAGASYQNFEFWPGPLNEDGSLPNPDDCSAYDRIWTVSAFDLDRYEEEGIAALDLAEWPVELGAPVIDGDGVEGNYNLEGGDRPAVYGHQTAFWVMNDVGNVHERTGTEPIGLEVRVTAFTSIEALLRRQTFYRYEVVNRNSAPFENARFGLFADPDLGDAADDYVGSDSTRGLAFVYNGNTVDGVYGIPPAAGYDLLSGADVSMYFENVPNQPTSDPQDGAEIYSYLNGLWRDGAPMTEGGNGYQTGGPVVEWAFPGTPESGQFWSEVNTDGTGSSNPSGDRRNVLASEAFTLAPGESRTFDLAILFAQGDDRFDSISELRSVSDIVQARYDAEGLFAPSVLSLPPAGTLSPPDPLSPEDGATILDEPAIELSWTSAPGAEGYRIEVATDPDFVDLSVVYTDELSYSFAGMENEAFSYYWRVQAVLGLERSLYSDTRSFTLYRYVFDDFGNGTGIVEVAYPDTQVCPDEGDPGCSEYGGNTVWLSPNSTDDYVLTNSFNNLSTLLASSEAVNGDDFEVRFTEACAEEGACLAVYGSAIPGGTDLIASVPFELWNAGAEADPTDEVRMIPFLRATGDAEPTAQWADTFPDEQEVIAGGDALMLPVTQRVAGVMPDREGGYALFEAAANSFGGPGATYLPEADGDTQVDSLSNGQECRRQNYYVDFCYRDANVLFVAPLGGLDGFVLADLAGDGTTPPVGTTIRFDANERLIGVAAEDGAPTAQPQALALDAAYPNPFGPMTGPATVGYRLTQPADVRLAVYDVLGRRVAVLAEGRTAAGEYHATFEAAGLTSGVYLIVLEADGQRQSKKVMLVR